MARSSFVAKTAGWGIAPDPAAMIFPFVGDSIYVN